MDDLVSEFAENVAAQADAVARDDPQTGNRYARKYINAFKKLRALGDPGREALVPLLKHERPDVRIMAAAYLMRYCTQEARAVLEAATEEPKGRHAFSATQALKRWDEGDWHLDPP